jgi:hypothetical protein
MLRCDMGAERKGESKGRRAITLVGIGMGIGMLSISWQTRLLRV